MPSAFKNWDYFLVILFFFLRVLYSYWCFSFIGSISDRQWHLHWRNLNLPASTLWLAYRLEAPSHHRGTSHFRFSDMIHSNFCKESGHPGKQGWEWTITLIHFYSIIMRCCILCKKNFLHRLQTQALRLIYKKVYLQRKFFIKDD